MKLWFDQGNKKEKRLLGDFKSETAAKIEIQNFCDERNFKIYYWRWWDKDGMRTYDVGSWSQFFILELEE